MKVAILGSGQLARMMAMASKDLGIEVCFMAMEGEGTESVDGHGEIHVISAGTPADALFEQLGKPDVITVEKEDVDTDLLRALQPFCQVHPNPDFIDITRHRNKEKRWLNSIGLATAQFGYCDDEASLRDAVAKLGLPAFVKSCEQGYDGKNQWLLRAPEAVDQHLAEIIKQPCVVEKAVDFSREISIIGIRDRSGKIAVYPAAENHHWQGTLLCSFAPAQNISPALQQQAHDAIEKVLQEGDYVGVVAMECFVTDDGLLVNELAPRVHNSGHWSMEGCDIDQFSAHLLAICGRFDGALGEVRDTAMINLLGVPAPEQFANAETWVVHMYNKAIRPRRKVGHMNLVHDSRADIRAVVCTQLQEIYTDDNLPIEEIQTEYQE